MKTFFAGKCAWAPALTLASTIIVGISSFLIYLQNCSADSIPWCFRWIYKLVHTTYSICNPDIINM